MATVSRNEQYKTGRTGLPLHTGGCQCGAVRYSLVCESLSVYACHCLECQKQSASAFALSIPVSASDLEINGITTAYKRPTDSGAHTNCWFCPTCGTRLYHHSTRSPDIITLKGGTLDNTALLRPVAHLWTRRKQKWVQLPADAIVFETQPKDLKTWRRDMLIAANDESTA